MLLTLAILLFSVRPEPVEGLPFSSTAEKDRASTSSARTGDGVIEAERAFAAAAQRDGQWTAFRAYAAPDATMFVPQPVNAQEWLKGRKDPPRAIAWWPTAAWISCDGKLAVTTGGWKQPNGTVGFFSTVWQLAKQGEWKWIVDGGDALSVARPRVAESKIVRASCSALTERDIDPKATRQSGFGGSPDRSLLWEWSFNATGKTRVFSVSYWNGSKFVDALEDLIAVE